MTMGVNLLLYEVRREGGRGGGREARETRSREVLIPPSAPHVVAAILETKGGHL